MAYTILRTDGSLLTVISNGNVDTVSTSLSLPGAEYLGYGLALNENLVHLLENFASNTAPSVSQSQQGQLWFDKRTQTLKVFSSNAAYVPVSGTTVSATAPVNNKTGDFFYSTITAQLAVFDGSSFKTVGPGYTAQQGVSGAIPTTTGDAAIVGLQHNFLTLQFGNVAYATVSGDAEFVPSPSVSGFPVIKPGLTFNAGIGDITITANLVGSVIGNLLGSVRGDVVGNVTATTVTATNLIGNLTTTTVSATNLIGTVTGNINSIRSSITNFSSANAVITGGRATNLIEVAATTLTVTNFGTGNVRITGGYINNLANITADQSVFNNVTTGMLVSTDFSSSNVQVTGGSLTNLVNLQTQILQGDNFSSPNVQATGGSLTGITNIDANQLLVTNFSSPNVQITSGNLLGITNANVAYGNVTFLTVANATINGGNIVNTPIYNAQITNSTLVNPVATTQPANDRTTKLATTEFVHNVVPTGAIIMWGGAVVAIPPGWQLCDGSNSTPDLRDRFIVGAGNSYGPGAFGGNTAINLKTSQIPSHLHSISLTGNTNTGGTHTHTATVTDPGHLHNSQYSNRTPIGTDTIGAGTEIGGMGTAFTFPTTTASTGVTVTVNSAADHIHSVTLTGNTGNTGGTESVDIRPQYYALCYIQKVY